MMNLRCHGTGPPTVILDAGLGGTGGCHCDERISDNPNTAVARWERYRAVRLRSLAESPDAFRSTLAEEQQRTDRAWAERLSAAALSGEDCPLIAEDDQGAIGLVWAKVDSSDKSAVNVFQMWVSPQHRPLGVGRKLLGAVISWAQARNARSLHLGVTCGDSPAVRLYVREGFQAVGSTEALRSGSELLAQSMMLSLGERGT